MYYPGKSNLFAFNSDEHYDTYVFPLACFATGTTLEQIVKFLNDLKEVFNRHRDLVEPSTVLALINECFENHADIFTPVENGNTYNEMVRSSMIFAFCHFMTRAHLLRKEEVTKMYLNFTLKSTEFFYPLNPEININRKLTNDFFEKMKQAQSSVVTLSKSLYE